MKSILSIFFALVLSVSLVTVMPVPAVAQTTYTVDDDWQIGVPPYDEDTDGDNDFATINAAIAAASPGGTVYVSQGTYDENLIITESLTLTGEDRDTTIIQEATLSPIIDIRDIPETGNVTINNLTIKNDGREGVYIRNSSNISLVNNNISGHFYECIKVDSSTDINIVGNSINASKRAGISFLSSSNSTISSNTIYNNMWHGIYLSSSDNNTVTGNTINNNGYGLGTFYGIFVVLSKDNEVYNNNFIDNSNQAGMSLDCSGTEFNLDPPIGGNYWDNWTEPDTDEDGFVDSPYEFGGGVDDLPWVLQDGWKEIPTTVDATVDIKPDTLNLNNRSKWITCYIELEEGYDAADINVSTIELNDEVGAEVKPTGLGDYDEDGIPDLMVKFDRTSVQGILEVGDEVEIVITGELTDETSFEGTDTIKVIDKSND